MECTITISIWEKPTAAPTLRRAQERRSGKCGGEGTRLHCEIGKSAIVEVLSPGQRPTKRGLITRPHLPAILSVAHNRWLQGYRASVYDRSRYAVRPDGGTRIKMATRTELANRWFDLMDIMRAPSLPAKRALKRWAGSCSLYSRRRQREEENLLRSMGTANQLAVFNPAPVT